jgi:short-subunit dehydrogenase
MNLFKRAENNKQWNEDRIDYTNMHTTAQPTVHFFNTDLASPTSIASSAASIKATLGSPTVLINNAGVARGKTILTTTESDIRLTFNVNTLSHYFLAQQFLPEMIAKNHGMVVTVASLASYMATPNMVDYASSKAAALAFHEGLSAELASLYKAPKVRTIVMCPGYTKTALFEGFDPRGALYPETVAEELVRAVFEGKSAHITLSRTAWGIAPRVRGWPVWMQYGLRARLASMMKSWKGRQVAQPSEVGEKKGVEESGVLVANE